jgi:glucokinase
MGKCVFGVDVGGTTVKIGLFGVDGVRTEVWEIPTRTGNNGNDILPDVAESIMGKMDQLKIKASDVAGVGVGAPGPVDIKGIVHNAVNLGWGTMNISSTLGGLLGGIKVEAGNDANVAALGEQWKGGGQGFSDMIMVTLGTGVGGGIIVEGNLVAGATGAGGEIGHMHIEDHETEKCNCGRVGCFEQYASATGVVRIARKVLASKDDDSSLRDEKTITSRVIFAAAAAGDKLADEIVHRYGYYLGKGLAVIATIVNPEIIVLGGGVSKAGSVLIDLLKPSFEQYVFPGAKDTGFALATLGNDAGMYGAAKLVL